MALETCLVISTLTVLSTCRTLGGSFSLAIAAAIINNRLRSQLTPLGFAESLVSAIIDDPTAIWRPSGTAASEELYALPVGEKDEIIEAYVSGFRIVFLLFCGLIGWNA